MTKALMLAIVGAICSFGCERAHAAFIDTATEAAAGVVFGGVGTFDLTNAPIVSTIGIGGAGVSATESSLTQNGGRYLKNALPYASL